MNSYPPNILEKLNDLAEDFDGTLVIEASKLQQSWLAPGIFAGKSKQPRQAVADKFSGQAGAYFVVKKNRDGKYALYTGDPNLPQAKYLVKVDVLLSSPDVHLVDPSVTPPRGRLSDWLRKWLGKWPGGGPVAEVGQAPLVLDTTADAAPVVSEGPGASAEGAEGQCHAADGGAVQLTEEPGGPMGPDTTTRAGVSHTGDGGTTESAREPEDPTRTAKDAYLPPQPLITMQEGEAVMDGISLPFIFRGERTYEGLLIRAADVAHFLGLSNIYNNVVCTGTYTPCEHYFLMAKEGAPVAPHWELPKLYRI